MLIETEEVVVKNYRVRAYHEECGGEWISTGNGYSNSVKSYKEHRCNCCAERQMFDQSFPRIDTKYYPLDSPTVMD